MHGYVNLSGHLLKVVFSGLITFLGQEEANELELSGLATDHKSTW